MEEVFDWLLNLVAGNPWTYLVITGVSGGDVVLPLLPSETVVITASVIAARGSLAISIIVAAAIVGAFAGDNVSFWLGRRWGPAVAGWLFRGEQGRARLQWAEGAITRRGPLLIFVGRFIPGGRTVSTFAAGTMGMPYRRFLAADGLAAVSWGVYASMLGYLGGAPFQHSLWKPLAVSLGIALAVSLAGEAYRRLQRRRGKDVLGDQLDPEGREAPR